MLLEVEKMKIGQLQNVSQKPSMPSRFHSGVSSFAEERFTVTSDSDAEKIRQQAQISVAFLRLRVNLI